MSKKELLVLVVFCFAVCAVRTMAGSGITTTYININNQGSSAWYDLQAATGLTDFNNYDFGSFTSSDTFSISGSEVNIWKNGDDEIYAANVYYRIYLQSGGTPGFTSGPITWTASATYVDAGGITYSTAGDEKWAQLGSAVNILNGLAQSGTYVIEVRNTASGWLAGNHGFTWTLDASNGGANYSATFEYTADEPSAVPEPAAMGLFVVGFGLVFLARQRRLHA